MKKLLRVQFNDIIDMEEIGMGMYLELECNHQTYVGKFRGLDDDLIMLQSGTTVNTIGIPYKSVRGFYMDENEYKQTDHYYYGL